MNINFKLENCKDYDSYRITIIGDDIRTYTASLSTSEAESFLKIISKFSENLEVSGLYAPDIKIQNTSFELRESYRKKSEAIHKKNEELRIKKLSEPTPMKMAFAKAMDNTAK